MFCRNCGTELKDGARFCARCGTETKTGNTGTGSTKAGSVGTGSAKTGSATTGSTKTGSAGTGGIGTGNLTSGAGPKQYPRIQPGMSAESKAAAGAGGILDKAKELGKMAYEGLGKGAGALSEAVAETTDKLVTEIKEKASEKPVRAEPTAANRTSGEPRSEAKKKNLLKPILRVFIPVAAVVVILLVVRAILTTEVGVWKPDTTLGGMVAKEDFNLTEPEELLAYTLLTLADNSRMVLGKDGTFLAATSGGKSIGLGMMSYTKEGGDALRFQISAKLPVIGEISTSLRCSYRMKNPNTLILNIKGYDIYFVRAKGEKAQEYIETARQSNFSFGALGEDSELGNKINEVGDQMNQYGDDIKKGIEDTKKELEDKKKGIKDSLGGDLGSIFGGSGNKK